MVHRSFSELSKAAFTLLYYSIVRTHLEFAMVENSLDIKATWRGFNATCLMRKGFANSTSSHWNADVSELTLS